jgi:vanillate O-demethylase monooxygenase subunit
MGSALPTATIHPFRVIEQNGFIWVYLGDLAKIDEVPPPHVLEWTDDATFACVQGQMEIKANYMLLKENVLDLTHFGYVHAKSFGISDWIDPPRSTTQGDITSYHKSFVKSSLPPIFADPLGLPAGTPFNRENYGSFVSPALQIAAVDFVDPESGAIKGKFRVSHATTPIDATSMVYFYVIGRDHGTSPEEMQGLLRGSEIGFAEDEAMIEAVQEMMSRDPRGASAPEISVKSDAPGVQARRIVERWMAKETG